MNEKALSERKEALEQQLKNEYAVLGQAERNILAIQGALQDVEFWSRKLAEKEQEALQETQPIVQLKASGSGEVVPEVTMEELQKAIDGNKELNID